MHLGCFSVSLAVKDLAASRAFYEALGFEVFHDQSAYNWVMMKQGETNLGLFQGMFEGNILTFNPGWGQDGKPLEGDFTAVPEIAAALEAAGLTLTGRPEAGRKSITLVDPDGNAVLIDQHV